jgi:hypothetical protein
MKLDSNYFDRIRIKPEKTRTEERVPGCDWPGCGEFGRYPAPKGRDHEGQYHLFCLDHVRGYNKSYNYFAGMSDTDVMSWQRRSVTGHRPTWPLGARAPHTGRQHEAEARDGQTAHAQAGERIHDPFDLFGGGAERNGQGRNGQGRNGQGRSGPERPQRPVRGADLKQLHSLGLDETATPDQVKAQYKTLVKRLHPDANGGSRANEDKLREIIQAYGRLRETGFC